MALSTPIAFWNFDESSGNAVDATGNGYTLTNNNTITYTTGKINNCATLGTGNTNKYFSATVVDPDSYNSGFSISFWLYFNTVPSGSDNDIFEFQDTSNSGIFMRVNSSTSTEFRFGTGNAGDRGQTSYTSSWSSGTWYHIAMVHNATSNTYYVNGSQVAQKTTGTITLGGNQSTLNIGRNTANVNYSNVRYDMFGVFGYELSSAQVTELYNAGTGIQFPFPVAYTLAFALGTYAYTGFDIAFTKALNMLFALGTYTYTGFDILFSLGKGIIFETGSYIYTGFDIGLTKALTMVYALGTYTYTGFDFVLTKGMSIVISTGSYIYTGYNILMRKIGWDKATKSNTSTYTNATKSNTSSWINQTK